jgi:hypothetical protein
MIDKEINAAIAEACGWTGVNIYHRSGKPPKSDYIGNEFIPNYCLDLNAMHEAEKVLRGAEWDTYVDLLADTWIQVAHATARQRAEAFLRTIGKWEDGK